MKVAARTGLTIAAGLRIPEQRLAELLSGELVDDVSRCVRDDRTLA
jgi:hypothetical protein